MLGLLNDVHRVGYSDIIVTHLSNTPTNLCMALLNFLLFCLVPYCYTFVQYCYLKSIQYNAMHKFVGVLDNPEKVTTKFLTPKSPQIPNCKPPKAFAPLRHYYIWVSPRVCVPLLSLKFSVRRVAKGVYFFNAEKQTPEPDNTISRYKHRHCQC